MSMKEEDFASFLWALENTPLAWAADDIRERDTTQREALVEMKVERDQWRDLYNASIGFADRYKEERNAAQAQLKEAVSVIHELRMGLDLSGLSMLSVDVARISAFLARQADQEE